MRGSDLAMTLKGNRHGSEPGKPEWPNGAPFALFLSHDIDQIHDREMWRILADVNHIRRIVVGGETGSARLAACRVARALFEPKPATQDFATILEIEARWGFRSTFFVLHDHYWKRYGARFRIHHPEMRQIAQMILEAGCEIALHGGFYRFNDPDGYRESRLALEEAFGTRVVGIRNHLLRWTERETWAAQAAAGFSYDATFGRNDTLGPRDGAWRPFWAVAPTPSGGDGLVELPLTVMDSTLFRHLGLGGEAALDRAWASIVPVIESGGLVTLSWHNNYFNEPEYWDWQWVYERLLERLAALDPWCETGAEISRWWKSDWPSLMRVGKVVQGAVDDA
ncbi:MAG TPA: polysaccharide deacetylase family protein [Thermoanaerobaculaceae bacterium]|nr:polysaccharide deacetylase family protein [Thermoanaerobaculaceae bacterium]